MKMTNEIAKIISKNNDEEIYNTFYLSSNIEPSFIIDDGKLIIKTTNNEICINITIECLLRTLSEFTFCPLWYFKNELSKNLDNEEMNTIYTLVDLNIIFIENTTNGAFIRPTPNIYKLFKTTPKKIQLIPYNMLTHEMSKFDIFYKVLMGQCDEINKYIKENKIEKFIYKPDLITYNLIKQAPEDEQDYSVIGLLDGISSETELESFNEINYSPIKIIDEAGIKIDKQNVDKIEEMEKAIISDLKQGKRESYELFNYNCLFVESKQGAKAGDFFLKYPDLIIPIKRNGDLSPNTIGIEMELTPKLQEHYDVTIKEIKNNLKYGCFMWFVTDFRTKARLYEALKRNGGSGTCKTIIVNYTIPREYNFIRKINS